MSKWNRCSNSHNLVLFKDDCPICNIEPEDLPISSQDEICNYLSSSCYDTQTEEYANKILDILSYYLPKGEG